MLVYFKLIPYSIGFKGYVIYILSDYVRYFKKTTIKLTYYCQAAGVTFTNPARLSYALPT